MTEAKFQTQVIEIAKYRGWKVMHQRPAMIRLRGWHLLGDIAEMMTSQVKNGHKFYTVETKDLRPMADLKAVS